MTVAKGGEVKANELQDDILVYCALSSRGSSR